MAINSQRLVLILASPLILFTLCSAQMNDQIGSAALQTYRNFDSAVENEDYSEIPSKYWSETLKALQLERIYLHNGNLVMVLHTHDGAEEGWYFPISQSFRKPYLGIQTEDGFTFKDNNSGHGYPFRRINKQSAAPNDPNWLFHLERNYDLVDERGEGIDPIGGLREIPSKCWPDSLKAMNPIRVYMDGLNYAIVLRIQNGVEEGKYYVPTRSSDAIFSVNGAIQKHGQFVLTLDPGSEAVRFTRKIAN